MRRNRLASLARRERRVSDFFRRELLNTVGRTIRARARESRARVAFDTRPTQSAFVSSSRPLSSTGSRSPTRATDDLSNHFSSTPLTYTIPFSTRFKSRRMRSISSTSPSTMMSVVMSSSAVTIFTFICSLRPAFSM